MSNPARELHGIYSSWQARIRAAKSNGSPKSLLAPAGRGFDEAMVVASLLVRMRQLIAQLAEEKHNVELYERQMPGWFGPLAMSNSSTHLSGIADSVLLDQIEGFANFLDGKVPVISAARVDNLREVVSRAIELLESDPDLPEYLKTYIRRLLQQIRAALEDDLAGSAVDVGSLAYSLWVAFAAAEGASETKSVLWKDLGLQLLTGTISGALVQGTTFAIASITG